jgi:hypothetical protein
MTTLSSRLTGSTRVNSPFLAHDDLIAYPSIMATHPAGRTSSRYTFIPTTRVIEQLERSGFYPVKCQESKANEERKGFQKHLVRFRQPGASPIGIDQIFPEIVLTNSHDAGAAFILMAGLFRLVCTNGMIVGESLAAPIRINHVGYKDQAVREAVAMIGEQLPRVMDRADQFKALEMTPADREVFGFNALRIKYGDEAVATRSFEIPALMEPRRAADRMDNLWAAYNVVQERLVETGGKIERRTLQRRRWDYNAREYRQVTKMRNVQPTHGPTENVRVNKDLWNLAEGFEKDVKANGHWAEGAVAEKLADMRKRVTEAKKAA